MHRIVEPFDRSESNRDDARMTWEPPNLKHVDLPLMRRPYAFALSVAVVLLLGGVLFYAYGLPLLDHASIWCGRRGCRTAFGTFMIFLCSGLVAVIGGLWRKFR